MNENRFASTFLIPGGLWLLALFVTPVVLVLALSFGYTDDLGEAIYGFEFTNYERVFDPDLIPVLLRSVGFALATVVICLLIGYPVAYYIAIFGGRWKNVLLALVVLPFFVNYLIRTYAWIAMLGDDGLVNGLLDTSIRFINTPYAVIGGLVYGFLAFMILPIFASLDNMDRSLIEAGKDLYGGRWQTFRHVTLPHSYQGILAGCGARIPAGRRRLRGRLAAGRAGGRDDRQPDPAAVPGLRQLAVRRRADDRDDGFPADLDVALPARGGTRGEGGGGVSTEVAQSPSAPAPAARPARPKPPKEFDRPRFLKLYLALFFLVLFVPIVLVILFSFNSSRSLQNFDGFSLRWYETFFESESLRDSLIASVEIALLTMVVATVLGTLLAYGLVRTRTRWSNAANILMLIPLVTPEIVAGASALLLFTQVGLELSLTTIVLAHITFSISYVTVVVRARLVSLGREVESAAMDLGATRWQTFRLVTLPALWPAVLAAGLLVFALSFDDFVLSFFTTGESPQPLPVRIWTQIRFGVRPTINAIGTFMLVVSVLSIALALLIPRLFGRKESGLKVLLGREGA